ncbi:NfeD family protein [Oceanibium sediminis]|uniref:NfeD family protein n=1 Tax=Oceanibium sediminis TaxID=2026339 RepID=UPI000DD43B7B|nr:NfeD family protein [Oceanibium sediminis]
MDWPFFDLLEGLSPWWWVAFGVTLMALEMLTLSFFLIWPGLAAIAMAVLLGMAPTMPGEVQLALYGSLAVAATFTGRLIVRRFGDGGAPVSTLNDRGAQMVGRHGTLLSSTDGEATVEIDGVHWRARLAAPAEAGTRIEVIGAKGMMLTVRSRTTPGP